MPSLTDELRGYVFNTRYFNARARDSSKEYPLEKLIAGRKLLVFKIGHAYRRFLGPECP